MIKPDKYMNLNLSVINIGGIILKSLSRCPIQKYDDLENIIITILGEDAKYVFNQALSFLFLLGKINYQSSSDAIKLVEV